LKHSRSEDGSTDADKDLLFARIQDADNKIAILLDEEVTPIWSGV
jgi:hypothetical protein